MLFLHCHPLLQCADRQKWNEMAWPNMTHSKVTLSPLTTTFFPTYRPSCILFPKTNKAQTGRLFLMPSTFHNCFLEPFPGKAESFQKSLFHKSPFSPPPGLSLTKRNSSLCCWEPFRQPEIYSHTAAKMEAPYVQKCTLPLKRSVAITLQRVG